MNMKQNQAAKDINVITSFGLPKNLHSIEEQYAGKLDIQVNPYTKFTVNVEMVLEALAEGALFSDGHNPYSPAIPNPYRIYALFKTSEVLSICPVHRTQITCLNPVRVNKDGEIELSVNSVGGNVTAAKLDELMSTGYIEGYVKVLY